MTLKGIDISNWQHTANGGFTQPFLDNIGRVDFVIIKATQGTTYTNPYWASDYAYCKKKGKLLGVYHYAAGGSARNEADFFYKRVKGVLGETIPCLDWEGNQNSAWGNTAWAWSFAQRFHELSGVWPMIYVQASALRQVAACAGKCALWLAGYPDMRANWSVPAFPYSTSPWGTYTIWQFSSGGNIDRNTAKLDRAGWLRIAAGDNAKEKDADSNVLHLLTLFNEAAYISRKDGKMIQTFKISVKPEEKGGIGKTHIDFPAAFSAQPAVFACAISAGPGDYCQGPTVKEVTEAGCNVYVKRPKDDAGTGVFVVAIGE